MRKKRGSEVNEMEVTPHSNKTTIMSFQMHSTRRKKNKLVEVEAKEEEGDQELVIDLIF